jgi:hypothetical protein
MHACIDAWMDGWMDDRWGIEEFPGRAPPPLIKEGMRSPPLFPQGGTDTLQYEYRRIVL